MGLRYRRGVATLDESGHTQRCVKTLQHHHGLANKSVLVVAATVFLFANNLACPEDPPTKSEGICQYLTYPRLLRSQIL